MKDVRVRYAPSPTGFLHIGNARTALFNYLFAKKHRGSFIVRIEDTDIERNVEGGIESQMKYLNWLGIEADETIGTESKYGPYRQLERLDLYKEYADKLLESGHAYKCYCSPEDLEKEREELKAKGIDKIHYQRKCLGKEEVDAPYSIRFKVPEGESYTFNDLVKGEVTFKSEDIGDFVIVKENGIPTYNFACVVDDALMEISHVLRGEDHITNTPRQMMIYNALGFEIPTFGHMTLIVNAEGKKLSKRDGSIIQFIEQYEEMGYLPEALFNFISLLGWSPEGKKEILSREQLVKMFDEKRLSKSPASFDTDKLAFINNRYIKSLDLDAFVVLCEPFIKKAGIEVASDYLIALCDTFKDRMSCGSEIVDYYNEFVNHEFKLDDEMTALLNEDGVKDTLIAFRDNMLSNDFSVEGINAAMKKAGEDTGAKGKMLFMPCRVATTAQMHGPDLPKALILVGKDETINRINKIIDQL